MRCQLGQDLLSAIVDVGVVRPVASYKLQHNGSKRRRLQLRVGNDHQRLRLSTCLDAQPLDGLINEPLIFSERVALAGVFDEMQAPDG